MACATLAAAVAEGPACLGLDLRFALEDLGAPLREDRAYRLGHGEQISAALDDRAPLQAEALAHFSA